jgi:Fe-S-cluster-containing hydrogenase component 2
LAEYCRQCADAACAAACPTEAISFDDEFHYWRVDEALCIACGDCVDACPYQAIRLDAVTGVAAKCDLCLGAAHCVEICPTRALTLE